MKYRKIPKISPRAYIFQRPFLRGVFLEGLLFEGAYLRRGLSMEGNLCFKIDWASFISGINLLFLLCFTLYLRAIFQVQDPQGSYISRGDLTEGFLCYWIRGLYLEGLIVGILRYPFLL